MPTDTRNIVTTVEVAGEGTYKKKLDGIANALKTLKSEQKVVDAQYDKSDKSLAALASRQEMFRKQLELQRAKLEAIRSEYAKTSEAMGANAEESQKLNREMNYANAAMIKTERTLREIEEAMQEAADAAEETGEALEDAADAQEEFGDSAEEAAGELKKIGSASKEQKDALKQLGKQAEETAGKLSKALTAATVTTIGVSAKEYMEFEAKMSNVATLADTTAVSLDDLADQALKASNKTGIAATDISQGAYAALSAGVDTANVMGYVTEAAKAAKAGQGELDDVIQGSTAIMNAWKISYSDATGVFEKLLVAQDLGQTTLGDISSQIGKLTGLAPQLNVSLEETLAATAALTKNGVQTSQAINGLKAVMAGVIKPTAEATKTAQELGLEFDAAALKSKGLTGFLADVMEKTGGSEEVLAKLFGSVEGLSQVMLLGGGAADDYAQALAAMESSAGKLDEAFSTVTDNSASRLQMAMNKIKNDGIKFGEQLAPYIDIASDSLDTLAEKIGALSDVEKMNLLETAAWVAGGLKAVSMISKLSTMVKGLTSPVGATTLAITALVTAIVAMNKAIEEASLENAINRFEDALNENYSGNMAATIDATIDASPAAKNIEVAIGELKTALTGMNVLSEDEQKTIIDMIDGNLDPIEAALNAGITIDEGKLQGNMTAEKAAFVALLENFGLSDEEINTIAGVYQAAADSLVLKVPNVYGMIRAALTDGEADTADVVSGLTTDLSGMFDEADGKLEALGTDAEGYAATLEQLEAETVAWITNMAGKSTEEVMAHLGELEALEARVQEVMTEIDAANSALGEQGRTSYELTAAGASTEQETIARGFQYAYQGYKLDVKEIEDKAAADRAALDEAYSEGFMTPQQHLEQEAQIRQWETDEAGKALKEYEAARAELMQGVIKAYETTDPEEAAAIKRLAELLDVNARLNEELAYYESQPQRYDKPTSQGMISTLKEQVEAVESEIKTILDGVNTEDGGLYDTINEIFGSGAFADTGIDTSNIKEVITTAMRAVGQASVDGLAEGMSDPEDKAQKAAADTAGNMARMAEETLQIHSPSKVFYGIGENAVEGMIQGVESKRSALVAKMRAIATAAADAARQALDIHSPSGVFRTIGRYTAEGMIKGIDDKANAVQAAMRGMVAASSAGNTTQTTQTTQPATARSMTVNVSYSGAFTRREAQRFGRELAQQMTAEAVGKGG